MGSDKARISYDEKQQYRSVVMQQGRVTLEADWNEAQDIVNEETRKDALDFVGPSGTPDDGYGISQIAGSGNTTFDFAISSGTMYVGGERVEFDHDLTYSAQSEWLDQVIDPEWISFGGNTRPGNELVYLKLREQEVSAVEDSALREVALGGPDTAGRLRLIQRIVRVPGAANDCAAGLALAEARWLERGLVFDPARMRLNSQSTLELGFAGPAGDPNPCEPEAQGGYLGADNQLIRVQISNASAGKLLWGYDNASFLYRIEVVDAQTLQLQSAPIDAFHEPQANQAIEVLLPAAQMSNGEYVAAPQGFVTTVGGYARDTKRVTLNTPLPSAYGDGNPNNSQPPRLYLRMWQQELSFTRGAIVTLSGTGLQVKLNTISNAAFHSGDFWQIAVRPSTPTKAYPERFLHGPQPPDGPRLWACPLAVIGWKENVPDITDCRNQFDNLVELTRRKLGGCCTVTLRPQDIKGDKTLQSVVDSLRGKGPAKVCLTPGEYKLGAPLKLTSENSNLIIEACPGKAILFAPANRQAEFGEGMFVLNRADNVTLRGLTFKLPQAKVTARGNDALEAATVSIGIRPLLCDGLTIADCEFFFPVETQTQTLFGAGIFAASKCSNLNLRGNRFIGGNVENVPNPTATFFRNPPLRLLVGFLHTPTFVTTAPTPLKKTSTMLVRAVLANANIRDNYFERLTAATLMLSDSGAVRINDNQVLECYAGFWLLALGTLVANASPTITNATQAQNISTAVLVATSFIAWDPIMLGVVLGGVRFPLPADFDLVRAGAVKQTSAPPVLNDSTMVNVAAESMRAHLTEAISAGAPEASATVDAGVAGSAPNVASTKAIRDQLFPEFATAVGAFPPATFAHELTLSLDISHNEVSTVLKDLPWSAAILIVDTDQVTDSQLTMSSNRVRSHSLSGTAGVISVNRCTVTGNLFFNEIPNKFSLVLIAPGVGQQKRPLPTTAITGNVFGGPPILAADRPTFAQAAPPPMNTWYFFNTQV